VGTGRASRDTHLRRDETTPKMGHPDCGSYQLPLEPPPPESPPSPPLKLSSLLLLLSLLLSLLLKLLPPSELEPPVVMVPERMPFLIHQTK
jgi:hypothetical protein